MRMASAITCRVFAFPKPKPAAASPSGKRSTILSAWIMVSPPEEGGDIAAMR